MPPRAPIWRVPCPRRRSSPSKNGLTAHNYQRSAQRGTAQRLGEPAWFLAAHPYGTWKPAERQAAIREHGARCEQQLAASEWFIPTNKRWDLPFGAGACRNSPSGHALAACSLEPGARASLRLASQRNLSIAQGQGDVRRLMPTWRPCPAHPTARGYWPVALRPSRADRVHGLRGRTRFSYRWWRPGRVTSPRSSRQPGEPADDGCRIEAAAAAAGVQLLRSKSAFNFCPAPAGFLPRGLIFSGDPAHFRGVPAAG